MMNMCLSKLSNQEIMIVGISTQKQNKSTRRSKQNTYHVMNKNIVSSDVTDRLKTKDGMPSGASPSLDAWVFLGY